MVVGLGQGLILRRCRHAVGAVVIEHMAASQGCRWHLYPTLGAYVAHCGATVLVWPLVQYNISGVVARAAARRFGVRACDTTILHDDLDVPVGKIKHRNKGSAGGNGVKSILRALGSEDIARVRIGIGRPPTKEQVISYVLSDLPDADLASVREACAREGLFQRLLAPKPNIESTTDGTVGPAVASVADVPSAGEDDRASARALASLVGAFQLAFAHLSTLRVAVYVWSGVLPRSGRSPDE